MGTGPSSSTRLQPPSHSRPFTFIRRPISRRALFRAAAILLPAAAWPQTSPKAETSQFDLSLLDDWVTPADLFFIREHFPAPAVSSAGWKVSFGGSVEAPYEISYDELTEQPKRSLGVTLECAENPVGGGLVSNAEWTGAVLEPMLRKAKPLPEARFVRFSGAEGFSRTIPLGKALRPDTLLAYRMNGERLPNAHGFPVRALVPGWYGMDSIKWLRKVKVLAQAPPEGYLRRTNDGSTAPVTAMNPKAAFARPLGRAVVQGRRFIARGAAWAGEEKVRAVEISTDEGRTWQAAKLVDSPRPYAWVRWEHPWTIPAPGEYVLMARASDQKGRAQPAEPPSSRLDEYELNAYQKVRVTAI